MRHTRPRAAALAVCAVVTAALTGATGLAAAPTAAAADAPPQVQRLYGDDRVGTAVAVSRAAFPGDDGSYAVFVVSAANWPDALAASALAARFSAPLLLVPSEGPVPRVVLDELDRLKPQALYVLGGTKSVSAAVSTELAAHADALTRFDGVDRYDTASYAASVLAEPGKPLYVASGAGFADALGGGAAAGAVGGSLVLTDPKRVPESLAAQLPTLAPSRVVVLGGPGVVDDSVVGSLKTLLPGVPVTRSYGADRYETAATASAAVNAADAPAADGGAKTVLLASGTSFADGLAGAAVSGRSGSPLVLTTKDCVPAASLREIERLGATRVVVLGGPGVVSDAAAALTPC